MKFFFKNPLISFTDYLFYSTLIPFKLESSVSKVPPSVCFLLSWTQTDLQTACRQMGYQGGAWWAWLDKQPGPSQPRLLLEQPRCSGTERGLDQCASWTSKQLGSGVCGEYIPTVPMEIHEISRNLRKMRISLIENLKNT